MTSSYDVIVVGAGPAGAIAARTLALGGVKVGLFDARNFPRAKVCGDALIPDSLALLREEGLESEVRAVAHTTDAIRLFVPSGRSLRLPVDIMTIERERFDALLVSAATRAGAELVENAKVLAPTREASGMITGVRFSRGPSEHEAKSRLVILACGAASSTIDAFGVRTRSQPSALALRAYYKIPGLDARELIISFEKPIMPGYGWIFPLGDDRANVGCGVFLEDGKTGENLRELFDRFFRACPHVHDLLARAEPLGEVRGAPLRCALDGAASCADGLLVAGEALGTTYSLSGEGIGKAMESGRFAARTTLAALERGDSSTGFLSRYERALEDAQFPAKFGAYRTAQSWMRRPWIVNWLVWKAERSPVLREKLADILREERPASEVLSGPGLLRALVT